MYLLTLKDGHVTRYVGPYCSPKKASDDLERVLATCSKRVRWQIHALEAPKQKSLAERINERDQALSVAAS